MNGWRQNIAVTREMYTGGQSGGWRNDISAITQTMGAKNQGWRQAARYMQVYIEENPPGAGEIRFFLNEPPRQPDTRYAILISGIIEADKVVMA